MYSEDNQPIYRLVKNSRQIPIFVPMIPDYPHKIFNDTRYGYFLLMETLAMGA
jgi:hypothetical protein